MKIFTLTDARILGHTTDIPPHSTMQVEANEISDNFHTMSELYEHRMALNAALFSVLHQIYPHYNNIKVMKSKLHNDGTMFNGYFIIFASFKDGKNQISYHYDLKHWNLFKIPEVERIPFEYDGHTSKDVIERLLKL